MNVWENYLVLTGSGCGSRDLTPELAYRIGRIAASLLGKEEAPVICDRARYPLSEPHEGALTAGITSAGATVRLLEVTSTPAVAM